MFATRACGRCASAPADARIAAGVTGAARWIRRHEHRGARGLGRPRRRAEVLRVLDAVEDDHDRVLRRTGTRPCRARRACVAASARDARHDPAVIVGERVELGRAARARTRTPRALGRRAARRAAPGCRARHAPQHLDRGPPRAIASWHRALAGDDRRSRQHRDGEAADAVADEPEALGTGRLHRDRVDGRRRARRRAPRASRRGAARSPASLADHRHVDDARRAPAVGHERRRRGRAGPRPRCPRRRGRCRGSARRRRRAPPRRAARRRSRGTRRHRRNARRARRGRRTGAAEPQRPARVEPVHVEADPGPRRRRSATDAAHARLGPREVEHRRDLHVHRDRPGRATTEPVALEEHRVVGDLHGRLAGAASCAAAQRRRAGRPVASAPARGRSRSTVSDHHPAVDRFTVSATGRTGIAPSAPSTTASATAVNRSGGANGRAASWIATIATSARDRGEGGTDRGLPGVAAGHDRAGEREPFEAALGLVLVPGRRGRHDRVDRRRGGGGRGRPRRASDARRSAGRPSGISAPTRRPAPAARITATARPSSMREASQTRPAAAGQSDDDGLADARQAREDHPPGGGLDHVADRASTSCPIRSAASSTTTIVPSSR